VNRVVSSVASRAERRRAFRLVMRREVVERGRDRGFLISTGVTLTIVLIAVLIGALSVDKNKTPSFTVGFAGPLAAQEQAYAQAHAADYKLNLTSSVVTDEAGAARQVAAGNLDALVSPSGITVKTSLDTTLGALLKVTDTTAQAYQRLQAAGIDPTKVAQAAAVPAPSTQVLQPKDPRSGERRGIAVIGSILLFAQLIAYCTWVAMGVVEEKSSRVVEVLLAAVPSRSLLAGKVFGIGLLGLVQLFLTVVVGLGVGAATGALHLSTTAFQAAGIVVVWFILGYAFYASAFAAVASRVSRQEDLQSATQPLNLLIMIGYFAVFPAVSNPDAGWVRVLSLVPPFSILLQPVRIAGGDAAWWQSAVAVVLMLLLTAGIIRAAARIYENSVLRFGSKVTLRTAWAASAAGSPEEGRA
jgi:ABC-2 type transport system permease protein